MLSPEWPQLSDLNVFDKLEGNIQTVQQVCSLLAAEAVLQKTSELGVAEGHKDQALLPSFAQCVDTLC